MTATASVSPTGDLYIDGVIYGTKWAVNSLTFSFPTSASFYGADYGSGEAASGFLPFNTTQQAAVRSILAEYSSVINFTFTETTETSTNHADLRYAESSVPPTAWAYMPTTSDVGGDAWFGSTNHWYDAPAVGNYARLAITHETGHTLGLKHPQTDSGTFGVMPLDHDSLEYTVMSYRSYIGASTTSGYTNEGWGYPQTLMMYDVAALQDLYGANYTTNSGNTVYKWNPLTGQEFINGVGQAAPGANRIFMNVWDGGGHDTYDFSNYTTNLKIDLSPGGWTTTSAAQLAYLGAGHYATGNISNSLLNHGNTASLIEDAVGGTGSDTITGNVADNRFTGGAGNDILNGDLGTDTAVYSGAKASYQIVHNANGSWTITDLRAGSPDGTDTLTNIEQAQFSDQLFALNGNATVASAPQVPTFTSFSNDSGIPGDHISNDTTLTFTGTGTAGSIIKLLDGSLLAGSAVADISGIWTVTTSALTDGAHAFTAVATNSAGNSAPSGPYTVTIDTIAPVAPTIAGFSPNSNVAGDGITNANAITLNGSGEIGATIQIFDGALLIGAATVGAAGTWSYLTSSGAAAVPAFSDPGDGPQAAASGAVLTDGTHHFTAKAVDAAGNTSGASAALDVTVDTLAPNAPVVSGFSPDSGTVGDGHTTANILTLAGTAEANSSVKIYDGTLLLGSAATGSTGNWNFATPTPLLTGAHSFTATATDAAGNGSTVSVALTVTIDPATAANHAPVVTATDVAAARNQAFAAGSLFAAADPDFNPITRYEFMDNSAAANSGHFVLNGAAQPALTIIDIAANQLAQTSFIAGAAPDTISVRAFDGTAWGAWTVFHVTAPDHAPVIVAPDVTATRGQTLAVAPLISASDADNDAITAYQFFDATTATNSGLFAVNGVVQPAATYINVSPSQLAQTSFVAGAASDAIYVRAYDGIAWGAWTAFHITVPDHAPVVTAADITPTRGQTLAVGSLITTTDADHDAITRYEFWDNNGATNSGHLAVNGAAQSALAIIDISASQLSQTTFVAGAAADAISVRAFDGVAWGAWTAFHITVPDHTPVVAAADVTPTRGQTLAVGSLITTTDADHDAIAQYEFWDNNGATNSGHLAVNGAAQPALAIIDISASQLSQTTFVAGAAADAISVRAFDGVAWGAWTVFHVTPPDHAPVVTATDITATANQTAAVAPHLSVTDADSDPITAYEFWDGTSTATGGHFVVNGVAQAAGTIIDVSASQLSQTSFQAGSTSDAVSVRAFDGVAWSPWTAFKVNVPAAAATAIKGTAGNDTLTSTAANETMTGGPGSDNFVFAPHNGKDIVTDFTAAGSSPDVLAFSHATFADAAAVLAHTAQVGANAVITIDAANSVTLDNVTTTILQQHLGDFHFLA